MIIESVQFIHSYEHCLPVWSHASLLCVLDALLCDLSRKQIQAFEEIELWHDSLMDKVSEYKK